MKDQRTRELLEECIFGLTEGEFSIHMKKDPRCTVFEIEVDRSEYGKICGAKGKMIRAIKFIWEACISRKIQKPVRVVLKEPLNGFSKGRQPNVPSEKFNQDWFHGLLEYVVDASAGGTVKRIESESDLGSSSIRKWMISNASTSKINPHDYESSIDNIFAGIAKANGGSVKLFFKWID